MLIGSPSTAKFHPNGSRTRLLLVSQRSISGRRLASSLLSLGGLDLVAEAASSEEALRLCRRSHPDVIFLDLPTPRAGDLAVLPVIHEQWPQIRLVVLTNSPVHRDLQRLHDEGVVRCLLETICTRKLAELLQALLTEPPSFASPYYPHGRVQVSAEQVLSSRERQVLGWMLTCCGALEIAERLGVNELTARFHVQNVLSKLRAVALGGDAEVADRDMLCLAESSFAAQEMQAGLTDDPLPVFAGSRTTSSPLH